MKLYNKVNEALIELPKKLEKIGISYSQWEELEAIAD
jgi:hypothetical protein